MAFDLVAGFAFPVADLARMALVAAIPAFLVVLPAQRLHSFLRKKLKASWIIAAFLATFIVILPIVFALYLIPFFAGYASSPLAGQPAPEAMQPTIIDYAMAVVATIFKNLLSALMFTVLLMPFLFFASFAEEKLKGRFKLPSLANTFIATFATTALAWVIVLFVFPWVVPAVLWKLYWGPI